MKTTKRAGHLLPTLVCAWCSHVMRRGASKISHGICRPCTVRFFGKFSRAVTRRRVLAPVAP